MADPSDIIDQAQAYASGLIASSETALTAVKTAIDAIPTINLSVIPISIPEYTPPDIPDRPTLQLVGITLPDEPPPPAGLSGVDNLSIDVSQIPALTAQLGAFLAPSTPSAIAPFGQVAPTLNTDFGFPVAPAQLDAVISAPVFVDHAVPTAPTVAIPVFEGSAPVDITQNPGDYSAALLDTMRTLAPEIYANISGNVDAQIRKYNPQYFAQMDRLEGKLAAMIDGGSAINPSIENATYEREKEKQNAEFRRASGAARRAAAKMGHNIPAGFVFDAMEKARQAAADNNARASREIAIDAFTREQENVKFGITKSQELRMGVMQIAVSYFNALIEVNNIALNAGKEIVSAMVEVFNGLIRKYEAQLEAYKSSAQVYETRVRGATAVIELYKAEIDAARALTEIDQAKLAIYRGEIDALQAYASIYKTKIEAVVSQAQLERLKIDAFGAQVEAYRTEISAKNIEWEAYRSALSANETQARVYGSQVQAYQSQVDAFRTVAQTKGQVIESQVRRNESLIRQYSSQVDAYRAIVGARGDIARVELEQNKGLLDAYKSELDAELARANSSAIYHKLLADVKIQQADAMMKTQFKQADLFFGKAESQAKLGEAVAGIYASSAQGAINGINSLVTLAG